MKKVRFAETLFAGLAGIAAEKDYLVSFQWDAQRESVFLPLKRGHKRIALAVVAILSLGLLGLAGEFGLWLRRELSLEYQQKQYHSLTTRLGRIQTEQKRIESGLDGLTGVEEKIRALYGMNRYDKSTLAFGVGGHRLSYDSSLFHARPVFESVLQSGLKNRQLQGKMDFTLNSFRQIEEFVKYRHNLWEHTPFVLPAKGEITSGFGHRLNPVTGEYALHAGLDIANGKWTPIYATADGIVASSEADGDFGNLVVIDHGNGYTTKFGHLNKIMVEKGQLVKRFDLIGYMGDTGRATGTHLHYEVHRDGNPQDPGKYILPSGVLVD